MHIKKLQIILIAPPWKVPNQISVPCFEWIKKRIIFQRFWSLWANPALTAIHWGNIIHTEELAMGRTLAFKKSFAWQANFLNEPKEGMHKKILNEKQPNETADGSRTWELTLHTDSWKTFTGIVASVRAQEHKKASFLCSIFPAANQLCKFWDLPFGNSRKNPVLAAKYDERPQFSNRTISRFQGWKCAFFKGVARLK